MQNSFSRPSSGHVAAEVNDGVAISDVAVELVERFRSCRNKVFLNVDGNIRPLQLAAQQITITTKLGGDRR